MTGRFIYDRTTHLFRIEGYFLALGMEIEVEEKDLIPEEWRNHIRDIMR